MTIHVVPTDFATVQDAITNANPGDSIHILAGIYDGFTVTDDKPRLKIYGCGNEKTIIFGNHIVAVNAEKTELQKLTVRDFNGDGIKVNSSFNFLHQVKSIGNENDGFEINGDHNFISDCSSSFNRDDGFDVNGNSNCIVDCHSLNNRQGGFCIDGNANFVLNNIAKENGSNQTQHFGFLLENNDENTDGGAFNFLFGNTARKNIGAGIVCEGADNNSIKKNRICKNESSGILLTSQADQNVIDTNTIRNNGTGGSGSGIFIADGAGGADKENAIKFNRVKKNVELDIKIEGPVEENIFDGNKCDNSNGNVCN
ncbi:NosD domain-containing protein [Bacillus spongiae]|uniref:NosD domain-containing protein n=1 Tax=Bacillus spongiae TaxID=2683610 RepID=A0ABU8HIY9_9BACI